MTGAALAMGAPQPSRHRPGFGVQVFAGMVIGLSLGFIARSLGANSGFAQALQLVGQICVIRLKAFASPLVFTAIVASILAIEARRAGPAGRQKSFEISTRIPIDWLAPAASPLRSAPSCHPPRRPNPSPSSSETRPRAQPSLSIR